MLSREKLEIYRNELVSENFIGLRSIQLLEAILVENLEHSSELMPKSTRSIKNMSWTDQWIALSGDYSGNCKCASCGRLIFFDINDPSCVEMAKMLHLAKIVENCTPEMLQVQGGHIVLKNNISDGRYILARKGRIFIVPLCRECNNYSVQNLVLKPGTVITPEIREVKGQNS